MGEGRMEEAVGVLLAPYLLGVWINSRWWTRKAPQPGEVVPDLWLSRLPSRMELERLRPRALVNCCAEMAITGHGRPVHAVPMLDLLVPEIDQIEQGVKAIAQAHAGGRTLVFCALGYSRSALLAVAYLTVSRGIGLDDAVAMVRRARPGLVLSPRHLGQLRSWYEQRNLQRG
jgi:protein-tyrosine phosphatase